MADAAHPRAWLIHERAWQEIEDPIEVAEEQKWDDALAAAGYSRALIMGPIEGGITSHFRLELWAWTSTTKSPQPDQQKGYPYLGLIDIGSSHIETVYCATLPDALWLCAQLKPLIERPSHAIVDATSALINCDQVTYVERCRGGNFLLHFVGGGEPLAVQGEDARYFWESYLQLLNNDNMG